jgi:hypothetical protein
MSGDSKKAFDTAHTSVPVYYPDELCLVGGADHLSDPRQRGPLDTKTPKDRDPLFRPRRLARPFKPGFVESIDAGGVMEDISIVLREGVPVVEYGQMRTRGARVVNTERKARCGIKAGTSDRKAQAACTGAGFPLVSLRCSGKKTKSDVNMLSRILAENHLRHDDDIDTTIDLMTQLLDATENNVELVARQMGVTPQTVRHLMGFHEHATKETRKAVQEGRVGITAAALLAREKDPGEQNKLLAKLIAAPDQTVRRAAQLSGRKRGEGEATPALVGKRALTKFRAFLVKEPREGDFCAGMAALIEYQTTGKIDDQRLAKLVKQYEG